MEFMHGGAARLLVVTVHVLGDDDHLGLFLQLGQGVVGGVGLVGGDELSQLLGAVPAPQGVLAAAEGGDAAGGGNAGAAQDGYLGVGCDDLAVFFQSHGHSLRGDIITHPVSRQEFFVRAPWLIFLFLILVSAQMVAADPAAARTGEPGPVVRFHLQGPGARQVAEQCLAAWREQGPALLAELDPQGAARDTITCLVLDSDAFEANFAGRLPDWGVGAALPGGRLIALDYARLPTVGRGAVEVFLHEMVHAILFQVTGRVWLPTWLHEGTAMVYSGEWKFLDMVSLVLDGHVPSLEHLRGRFPAPAGLADRAYRTSLLAVKRLRDEHGPQVVGRILAETARSGEFPAAFQAVTGQSVEDFTGAFDRAMNFRLGWAVMLTRWPTLFVILAVAFAVGAVRKMILTRRRLAEMEDAEMEDEDAEPLS